MQWSSNISRNNAISPILLILIFLISTDISILLNIPVFRQILGFIFLAFVPGAFFLCILKPDKLGLTEKFVLSMGLSVSFIMFIGILINTLYPLVGYETPLSQKSIVISLTLALLIMGVIAHFRGGFAFFAKRTDLRLDTSYKALVVIPILFLPLSVLGMHLMNTTNNNAMLMVLLSVIPIYVILISIWHNQIPEKAYPLFIFMTSISLVLLLGMRSSHIIGADAHMEYYIFQQTLSNEKWQILFKSTLDSCLSISVLPTIYQLFLGINPEYLFKLLYPILFSITSLVVYIITREYLGDLSAFLASFFFMSHINFLSAASSPRTTIAVLFFALSIMVLLNGRLSELEKRLLLIIFIFSCIVSHYSTTYIFFGVLLFTFIIIQITNQLFAYQKGSAAMKIPPGDEQNVIDSTSQVAAPEPFKPYITLGILMIFFVVIFVWYSQVTGTAFDSGVGFIVNSMRSLQDFFILESRQEDVAMAFGSGVGEMEVPRKISFVFNWLTILFIAIGVLTTLFRYSQRVVLPSRNLDDLSGFLCKRIDIMFLSFGLVCTAVIAASVALPFVSIGYGISRVYLLATVVLSSFFILGGTIIAELIRVRLKYLVVLVVLAPFFMCTTGTMYQVFGYLGSMVLNSEGNIYDIYYIHDQETHAAKWLKRYTDEEAKLYSDNFGERRLVSQGLINVPIYTDSIVELIGKNKSIKDGYVYLRYRGVVNGKLYGKDGNWHNVSKYNGEFMAKNLIYANGGSQVLTPSIIG
jgi:uncharacterized membrane protein